MTFAVKTVPFEGQLMLNICDSELVGRTVKNSDLVVNISSNYYAERVVDEMDARDLLKRSAIINMVGKDTVSLSISLGIGNSKAIKEIDGVPFLIVFKF